MSRIVGHVGALNAAWATRILAPHAPGTTVRDLTVDDVDTGTTTRVRLTVDHDGPAPLPRRWFVKLISGAIRARALTALPRLPQTEVRFYSELAAELPLPVPRALFSGAGRGRITLVLADVSERGERAGRPGEALTPDQAGAVIDVLAQLHAHHWNDTRLRGRLAWLGGPVRRLEDALGTALAVPLMRRGLDHAGDLVSPELRRPALRYAHRRRVAMRRLERGPRTVVHHDPHPGNLYWRGERAGLLDWQLVRAGDGAGDVAYLLATALSVPDRRAHERALIERYAARLAERGVDPGPPAGLAERIRRQLCYPFEAMVVTLAIGGLMADAPLRAMIGRAGQAVIDHDAFAALVGPAGR